MIGSTLLRRDDRDRETERYWGLGLHSSHSGVLRHNFLHPLSTRQLDYWTMRVKERTFPSLTLTLRIRELMVDQDVHFKFECEPNMSFPSTRTSTGAGIENRRLDNNTFRLSNLSGRQSRFCIGFFFWDLCVEFGAFRLFFGVPGQDPAS